MHKRTTSMKAIARELAESSDPHLVAVRREHEAMTWPVAYRDLPLSKIEYLQEYARRHYSERADRLMYWMLRDQLAPALEECARRRWFSSVTPIEDGNLRARVQAILDRYDPSSRVQPNHAGWYRARWGGLTDHSNRWVCLQVHVGATENGLCVTDRWSTCGVPTSLVLEYGEEILMPNWPGGSTDERL